MSSRKEEKERRKAERLAHEQEQTRTESRRRRIRQAGFAVVALAIVGGVAAAVIGGGGSAGSTPKPPSSGGTAIPAQTIASLPAAAKAAGCVLRTFPNYGQQHTTASVQYKTNPPTSGDHNPVPAQDGDFVGKTTPPIGMLVHALEHGRVEIQYRPGTPQLRQRQLETLLGEPIAGKPVGFDQLLLQNATGMPYAVAATAWTQLLGCPTFTDRTFDALRAFRAQYAAKGPESIPYPE